jgi:hypothetical protein
MLLVGSHAQARCLPHVFHAGTDWDVWVTADDLQKGNLERREFAGDGRGDLCALLSRGGRRYRMHLITDVDARKEFIDANPGSPVLENDQGWVIHIASPSSLVLIKRAYLYMPSGWHRHIEEYHLLVARLGPTIGTEAERRAYARLRASLLARLDGETADYSMRVSNEAFFSDFKYPWLRVHEHDDLHRATCYGEAPLYQRLKDDQAQAYASVGKFEQLPHADRIRLVREECYAIALERVLLPAQDFGISWDEYQAFQHALRRICTSLARGWFRDYAIDNYPEISRYDKPFLQEYHRALAHGTLRRKEPPVAAPARRAWLAEYLENLREKDRVAAMHHVMRSPPSGHAYYRADSAPGDRRGLLPVGEDTHA